MSRVFDIDEHNLRHAINPYLPKIFSDTCGFCYRAVVDFDRGIDKVVEGINEKLASIIGETHAGSSSQDIAESTGYESGLRFVRGLANSLKETI